MDEPAQTALSGGLSPREWPQRMGIPRGANLLLTADLTRVAWLLRKDGVAKVPRNFLDAFLEHVGPEGTVVVPTFNYDLRNGERYDKERTPTITGTLGQAALAHPAFQRTSHPLHSFAVAGALKDQFLAKNDPSSFGAASPFALFREHQFILLGLDMHLNYALSYFHHVEELEQVPYRRWRTLRINYSDGVGEPLEGAYRLYAKRPGYENELSHLQPILEAAGVLHTGKENGLSFLRLDLSKAHAVIVNDIRKNKARSLVKWTFRSWVRDTLHQFTPAKPSRSAQLLIDAGIR